jgi:hypothetical protein
MLLLLLPPPADSHFSTLVGGIQYVPVDPSSRIFAAAASWRLPSIVVCLASSYLQRVGLQHATPANRGNHCSASLQEQN